LSSDVIGPLKKAATSHNDITIYTGLPEKYLLYTHSHEHVTDLTEVGIIGEHTQVYFSLTNVLSPACKCAI